MSKAGTKLRAVGKKRCPKCGEIKGRDRFYASRCHPDGLRSACKECGTVINRKYKSSLRSAKLWRKYGLREQDYKSLHLAQKGCCAICGKSEEGGTARRGNGNRLEVDHDHRTGRVRGLLCRECNLGVGYFRDTPALLAAASDYVLRSCVATLAG